MKFPKHAGTKSLQSKLGWLKTIFQPIKIFQFSIDKNKKKSLDQSQTKMQPFGRTKI